MDETYKQTIERVKAKSASLNKEVRPESSKPVEKSKASGNGQALRTETLEGLQGLAKAMENLPKEKKVEDVLEKEEEVDDTYYYDETGFGSKRPNLYSNKRKKEIEARCKPIDIMTMITRQKAEQVIPIIPEKFVIKLRDITGKEDLFIKKHMAQEVYARDGLDVSKAYMNAKFGIMRLTFSLLSINDKDLSDIQIQNGKIDENSFWEKHEYISNFPIDILEELDWQLLCFMDRVKRVSLDDIKNF